jgi:hypothetical protein
MDEKEELSLKEKIDFLLQEKAKDKYKTKKFRLPWGTKVTKGLMKKGYITVVTMHDNKNINFSKHKIVGGTVKLDGDPISIHALDTEQMFFYKGRPFIFQPKSKLNPWDPLSGENETYGQKYVMARMEGDKLSVKKSFGKIGWIVVLVIVGIIAYTLLTGG